MANQEFPPLLTPGFHSMTLPEMRVRLVDAFRGSRRRSLIMEGFEKIEGEFWVDGSFLTKKLDPGDADILFLVQDSYFRAASTQQQVLIDWLARRDLRPEFYCHSFLHYIQEPGHPEYDQSVWDRDYWLRQFGFGRTYGAKGIATLKIP